MPIILAWQPCWHCSGIGDMKIPQEHCCGALGVCVAMRWLLLFKHAVQAFEYALTQLAELLDFGSILSGKEGAGAEELAEHTHVVPRQHKHQREGYKVAQCPPESREYPQQNGGKNQA